MESSVTRLLVATKMLLESLTKWSVGQRSEEDVSDIYVRLGNDFNSAKLAFSSYGIDMSDLNSVPDDLRDCLERCLSEDAAPAVLEVHLPRIREIIINLLQGLKMKQAEYKQFLIPFESSETEQDETAQATPRLANVEQYSLVDPGVAASKEEDDEEEEERNTGQPGPLTALTPQRMSVRSPRHTPKSSIDRPDISEHDPSMKALKNRDALERRASKRFSAYTFNKMGVGQGYGQGMGMGIFSSGGSAAGSPLAERKPAERRGSGARRVVRPPLPDSSPALEGLTSPSTFARTADYFGSSSSSGSLSGSRPLPRSRSAATVDSKFESIQEVNTPVTSTFPPDIRTPSPEKRREASQESPSATAASPASKEATDRLAPASSGKRVTSQAASSTDSLPFVDVQSPPSESGDAVHASDSSPQAAPGSSNDTALLATPRARSSSATDSINIFLQLGRQTRKAAIELDASNLMTRGISVARLRMLFIDRFAYSPGMEDFPTIYVKDPASGVTYELEDLSDVQEGSLLTLNIEPLDQVKQHLDLSLGNISRELRELKAALAERDRDARRMSTVQTDTLLPPHTTPTRISDSQFQAAGQRVAEINRNSARLSRGAGEGSLAQDGDSAQAAAGLSSTSSALAGSRIARELKVQFDELQNLRREFAVTRQLQTDFEGDVKSILSTVREQAGAVRAIASTKVAAERNFIVAGKARLDTQSQDLLTLIEDLQDTVDDLRVDVIQRGVKPRPILVKQIVEDVDRATNGLLELEGYVQTVKPSWKKTWESELQNIVDEQEFLNHEEGLLSDLRDDLSALKEVFSNIQQVVKLRGGSGKGGKYIPPLPEEGHEGLSTVMMEVKSQAVNHEKRLRALQAVERQRQKDLAASKTNDDFSEELAGFVDKKVLRKTGGVLEAERVRQRRDHATWKAMFGGGGPGGVPMAPSGSSGSEAKPKKLILGKKKGVAGGANEGAEEESTS
uniref:Actin interacting protein 3 C-terminal domain-containing protein n=1 Tax=Kalmanozyma brasiliensis (strain GHG001) TaxID=1365824 RepID=V5EXW4_KALBG